MVVVWYLNLIVIYKNSVVKVVLYIVFYQVKLNMRSKDSVIFQFLMSQITALLMAQCDIPY